MSGTPSFVRATARRLKLLLPGLSQKERVFTLRLKLLVGALLLTAVPVLLALAVLPRHVQATYTALSEARLVQAADDLALFTRKTMEFHLATVSALSTLPTLRGAILRHNAGALAPGEIAAVNRELYGLISRMNAEMQGLFLCGREGISFAGTLQTGEAAPYAALDVRDRNYFAEALRTRRPLISDPMLSKISGVPVVAMVAPVLDEQGDFAGLVVMSIMTRHLSDIIAGHSIGGAGYPFAIDRNGLLVAHPDPDRFFTDVLVRRAQAETLVERMLRGERGIESYVSSTGAPKIAAFAPVPVCGWSIGASIETAEFDAPAQRLRLILYSLLGGCLFLSLIAATLLSAVVEQLKGSLAATRSSQHKVAEQAALLDQTRDGIMVQSLRHAIQFWNAGATQLFGWTAPEVRGRRPDELLFINAAEFAEAARQVLQAGHWSGRLRKTAKSGAVLTLDCRWTLLRDEAGRPSAILSLDTDITERLEMEAKFLRAQRLESIGTLAGGIAHDLNNVLSPIVMGVDLLKHQDLSAENVRTIECMELSARRGAHLIKQVLSFARGVEGARVAVHLGYVVREVEAMIRSTFPKNIVVQTEIVRGLHLVRADPTQLNQVLLNLCVNARDAMPAGGILAMRVANVNIPPGAVDDRELHAPVPGSYVSIEVSDTGCGIAPEVRERMFEPFFTTKGPGRGTGLGLSTAIGIIRSHGGAVSVHSEVGVGTGFRIYLPATADEPAAGASGAPPVPPPAGHGRRILLVDDEKAILQVGCQALEACGYRVLTARDGRQAFAVYQQHRSEIVLVVTDLMMPLMDGLALSLALRRTNPAVPIIGTTGLMDDHSRGEATQAGIDHLLLKPYATAALYEVVAAALAGAAASPARTSSEYSPRPQGG